MVCTGGRRRSWSRPPRRVDVCARVRVCVCAFARVRVWRVACGVLAGRWGARGRVETPWLIDLVGCSRVRELTRGARRTRRAARPLHENKKAGKSRGYLHNETTSAYRHNQVDSGRGSRRDPTRRELPHTTSNFGARFHLQPQQHRFYCNHNHNINTRSVNTTLSGTGVMSCAGCGVVVWSAPRGAFLRLRRQNASHAHQPRRRLGGHASGRKLRRALWTR